MPLARIDLSKDAPPERRLRKSLGFNAASVLDDSSLGPWIAVVRECFLD